MHAPPIMIALLPRTAINRQSPHPATQIRSPPLPIRPPAAENSLVLLYFRSSGHCKSASSLTMATMQLQLIAMGLVAVQLMLLVLGEGQLSAKGYHEQWMAGHATWYGEPQGEGSSGGACGYRKLTGTPYGPKIAAGNEPIFQGGRGCGQCYDVKCSYASCRAEPTRVVITDQCPGGTYCSTDQPAFDFSGAAISAMAKPGQDEQLRNIGLYDVQYKRVPCNYGKQNVVFAVDAGSSPHWLSFTVKYQGGPGDIERVEISTGGSGSFQPAQHSWGANWMLINTSGKPFKGPYTVRIVAKLNGHTLTAKDVIPDSFQPGTVYESNVQFAY